MRIEKDRYRLFSRRAFILAGMKLSLFSVLAGRLFYLQFVESHKYDLLSDKNRIRFSLILPNRGLILDRHNKVLAENVRMRRLMYNPEQKAKRKETVAKLQSLLKLSDEDLKVIERKIERHNYRQPVSIIDYLSWSVIAQLELHMMDVPAVFVDTVHVRYYPYAQFAAHVLGYVGSVSQEEKKVDDPLLLHSDFTIGKNGIEKQFESSLRGVAGVEKVEANAYGNTIQKISTQDPVAGSDLLLTLDARLQTYCYDKLSAYKGGSVIVLDAKQGDVLSMVSYPSYDPNNLTLGISAELWQGLLNDPQKPLLNKSIAQQYPPGSTFKLVVALATLEEGIDPYHVIDCKGYVDIGERRFHCWKTRGHGPLALQGAIAHSCNCYFYTVSQFVGIENIRKMAFKLGFGDMVGIDIPGEISGAIPSKQWKKKQFGESWKVGDTLNCSIGQGYILTTPLQLATMTARIASGKAVVPSLMLNQKRQRVADLDISKSHLHYVQNGMQEVLQEEGTAYNSRIDDPRKTMAGKTGTAQIVSKRRSKEELEDEAWYNQNHALFVGYAPTYNPKYAISVVIEHGGSGSKTAAPLARDILNFVQDI